MNRTYKPTRWRPLANKRQVRNSNIFIDYNIDTRRIRADLILPLRGRNTILRGVNLIGR